MKADAFVSFVLQFENLDTGHENFIRELDAYLESAFENYEIILVDNTGDPEIFDRLKRLSNGLSGLVSVLELSRRQAADIAMLAGVDKSIGDFIFQMDNVVADFDLPLLSKLFEVCCGGVDIIFASPRGQVSARSRIFYSLFNLVSSISSHVETCRVILASRRALNAAINTKQRFRYQKALLVQSGFAMTTLEYESKIRHPLSTRSLTSQLSLATDLLIAYSSIGSKIGFTLSLAFIALSVGISAFAVGSYLIRQHINSGWTSLMLFMSISFGGLFFLMGILTKYLRLILLEIQGSPIYLVKSYYSKRPQNQFFERVWKSNQAQKNVFVAKA